MKNVSILFLKAVIILIAIGVLAVLVRFPQTEGRAVNLDLISIYTDPFIIYVYIASIPFFVALFQAGKLLGFVKKKTIFSQDAVNAVRNIKYCAVITSGFLILAIGWIRLASGEDDPAGAVASGIFLTVVSLVIAAASDVGQKVLQNVVTIKS